MARGRHGRGPGRGKKRKRSDFQIDRLDKKQKNHLREFGELHPADDRYIKTGRTSQNNNPTRAIITDNKKLQNRYMAVNVAVNDPLSDGSDR